MFDIEAILVYGWTWKYYNKNTDEMIKKVLGIDENEEEIEEMFQEFLYNKYDLKYGKAIPRRGGEDDAVCYISLPCKNKEELIQSFSTSVQPFVFILNSFELTSSPEIFTLISTDF